MSKGSRHVSLGPYRSTKLALEERLSKEEASLITESLQRLDSGFVNKKECNYNMKQISDIIQALGYTERTFGLYVNKGDNFIYISESGDSKIILASGKYEGDLERILYDIDIIKGMTKYIRKIDTQEDNKVYGVLLMLIGLVGLSGTPIIIEHPDMIGAIFLALAGSVTAYGFCKAFPKNHTPKIRKMASLLSKNAVDYSFGEAVYEQILCKYSSINAPKLETSESKQLPQEKKWAENQIGPETFVVSEATVKHFETPESERGLLETAPAFKGPALLGKGRDKK